MTRACDVRAACPLFPAERGGSNPTHALSAKSLRFFKCEHNKAKQLNRLWHSRFPELGGACSRLAYAAEGLGQLYAAAVWTNPSSPKLPQYSWLMLKRFAIADDRPANTASRMMGWMIRDIGRRFPEVEWLVSYHDPDSHVGTIYKATGWIADQETRRAGVMWHRGREHTANRPCRRVVRWLFPMWLKF